MKPDTEEYTLHDSVCMNVYQMPINLRWRKGDQSSPGAGGVWRMAVKRHRRLWGMVEVLCVLTVWWVHRCRQVNKEWHLLYE